MYRHVHHQFIVKSHLLKERGKDSLDPACPSGFFSPFISPSCCMSAGRRPRAHRTKGPVCIHSGVALRCRFFKKGPTEVGCAAGGVGDLVSVHAPPPLLSSRFLQIESVSVTPPGQNKTVSWVAFVVTLWIIYTLVRGRADVCLHCKQTDTTKCVFLMLLNSRCPHKTNSSSQICRQTSVCASLLSGIVWCVLSKCLPLCFLSGRTAEVWSANI